MRSFLLPIHIVFVGVWLGCVLTEALFERALLGKGRAYELILVALHRRVDVLVEIPAFVIVVLTGALMAAGLGHPPAPLLAGKILLGLVAALVNAYCVRLVFRRARAADAGHWGEFSRLDHLQHKFGAVVLLALVAALSCGIYLYAHP